MKTNEVCLKLPCPRRLMITVVWALVTMVLVSLVCVEVSAAQPPFTPLPQNGRDAERSDDPIIIRPPGDRTPPSRFQVPSDQLAVPDQSIELNAQFAGWQGVESGMDRPRLSDQLRANWIMVDENGRFDGRISAAEGASIENMTVFLLHMGRLVKETRVSEDGGFAFTNVREGAYALVGSGNEGFFAFGLNILGYNENAPSTTPRSVWPIAFQNETTINTDWIQYFAPGVAFRVYGRYPSAEGQDDPAALYGYRGLGEYLPKGSPATSISGHPVKLNSQGNLIGRIHQLTSTTGRPVDLRTTRVMLLQGDEVVAATDANNFGIFEFADVPEGDYGLMAAGADGVGLIGISVGRYEKSVMNDEGEFEVNGRDGLPEEYFDFCITPSETIGWLNDYAIDLAYKRNLLAPRRRADQNQICNACGGAGCNWCQGSGKICTSRCQTFEDWAQRCCHQREQTRLGSGYIISQATKDIREGLERSGDTFERAFYGESSSPPPAGRGGYGGSGYYNGGYNNNYGGYNSGYNYGGANYGYNGGNYAPPAPLP